MDDGEADQEMREAASSMAQERALPTADRRTLSDIASGKRKWIRWEWWEEVHGVVSRAKIAKIAEMADPERNPFENERNVAAAKLAGLKARTRGPRLGSGAAAAAFVVVRGAGARAGGAGGAGGEAPSQDAPRTADATACRTCPSHVR